MAIVLQKLQSDAYLFINLAHYYHGKRPYQLRAWSTSDFACALASFPDNDHGNWPGNETTCVHAYNIRKWRPSQWTAATECCEWLLLTRVNLRLGRCWVVGKLHAVMSIRFVLKSRWVLEPFLSYRCLNKSRNEDDEKWHFCYHTLSRLAVFRVAFGHLYHSCWSQRHSKRKPGRLNKLIACTSSIFGHALLK